MYKLLAVSAFPFEKTLNDFEFDFQPSLNKAKIKDLETLRFLDNKENVLFYGNSGVGNYRKFYIIERNERLVMKNHQAVL